MASTGLVCRSICLCARYEVSGTDLRRMVLLQLGKEAWPSCSEHSAATAPGTNLPEFKDENTL